VAREIVGEGVVFVYNYVFRIVFRNYIAKKELFKINPVFSKTLPLKPLLMCC